jgi:hypothetical protein
MLHYSLEQRVFLYDTYVKYGSAGKCRRKFRHKFRDERVPSRQAIHNLVNKLRTAELLTDKKTKHERRVGTEEKLDDIGARSNPRTEVLKGNIRREISSIAAENLQKVYQSLFRRCEECLRRSTCRATEFSTPSVSKGKHFPSLQMISPCWVIDKIRVLQSAGDAPVAVKRRAVNAWTSLKSFL